MQWAGVAAVRRQPSRMPPRQLPAARGLRRRVSRPGPGAVRSLRAGGMAFGYSAAPVISGEMAFPVPCSRYRGNAAMKVRRCRRARGGRRAARDRARLLSPRAGQSAPLMRGRPLDEAQYDARAGSLAISAVRLLHETTTPRRSFWSRPITPGFPHPPAYLLGVAAGADYRHAASSHTAPNYATAARRLYEMARVKPSTSTSCRLTRTSPAACCLALPNTVSLAGGGK